jgi:phage-related protein
VRLNRRLRTGLCGGVKSAFRKVVAGAEFALREINLMHNFDSQTIQLIIIAVAALAVVLQAIVLIAILISLKKATLTIHAEIQELRSSIIPVLINSRDFLTRVAPRVESVTADVADITHILRVRIAALESVVAEILERVQRQTGRVDSMFTGALDSVDRAGEFISNTVSKPMRHISALVASARAIVEALSAPVPRAQSSMGSNNEDKSV